MSAREGECEGEEGKKEGEGDEEEEGEEEEGEEEIEEGRRVMKSTHLWARGEVEMGA